MELFEEEMKRWEKNSQTNFAKVLTQIDNEFRKVILPTYDEYGFENTPISWLKMKWVMEENPNDKMTEYINRLLKILINYHLIRDEYDKLIIEDETLNSLITEIITISTYKRIEKII